MTLIPNQYFAKKYSTVFEDDDSTEKNIPSVFQHDDSIEMTFYSSGTVQQRPVSASFSIQPEVPLFLSSHILSRKEKQLKM